MKVLFLDIDGVVNCATTTQRHRGAIGIDPYMALLVGRIVLATNCEIVLSSSWRHWPDAREEVKKQVHDFTYFTPDIPDGIRGDEIKKWIDNWEKTTFGYFCKHQELRLPNILGEEIEKYAILDDNSDMLPEQLPNFFKTSWETGITEKIAKQVIKHLNYENKSLRK